MKRISIAIFSIIIALCLAVPLQAKVKYIKKASKDYDFKTVDKIVVMPITSDDVNFGKVADDRKPKIEAILTKTKKNLRTSLVKGSKQAKTSIPFYYTAPNKKPTTLILKLNIDQFDNGNQAARLVPFAGKSKVTIHGQFLDGQNKTVLADLKATAKAKGGFGPGGFDSEVLWNATNMANSEIMRYLKKLTGMTYSFWSGVSKGAKDGVKNQADVMKEEKREVDNAKKKTKK